jgi:hypothetical protein
VLLYRLMGLHLLRQLGGGHECAVPDVGACTTARSMGMWLSAVRMWGWAAGRSEANTLETAVTFHGGWGQPAPPENNAEYRYLDSRPQAS